MLNPEDANIFISHELKASLDHLIAQGDYSKIAVVVDENTEELCLPKLAPLLSQFEIIHTPSGEEHKTLRTCENIWEQMTEMKLDRKALVLNLGGGVIGDMGGFCASTYKRGIDFIQIPTTLLAQVDASVGGKLGIDFHHFKNHVGVFRVPNAVLIDTNFLSTLPFEELRSGFAEIIKHCLIADREKWKSLTQIPLEEQYWEDLADHSVRIKSQIADEDPLERGLRKILNFGHTVGHAIETHFLDIPGKRLLHGEAIAIGMICEAWISQERGMISEGDLEEICRYIGKIYPRITIPEEDKAEIIPYTLQDKKNEHNQIQCTLLEEVGKACFNQPIQDTDISQSIDFYNQLG